MTNIVEQASEIAETVLEAEYGGYQTPVARRIAQDLADQGLIADVLDLVGSQSSAEVKAQALEEAATELRRVAVDGSLLFTESGEVWEIDDWLKDQAAAIRAGETA